VIGSGSSGNPLAVGDGGREHVEHLQ